MKPLRCLVPVFFLVLVLSFSAHALVPIGTWVTPGDFDAGDWKEFIKNGMEGDEGNEITANSDDYIFQGALLTGDPEMVVPPEGCDSDVIAQYRTTYADGTLTLTNNSGSPWANGTAEPYVIDLKETIVYTCKYQDEMSFRLVSKGDFSSPSFPKYSAVISAVFDRGKPTLTFNEEVAPPILSSISGKLSFAQITITGPTPAAVDIKPGSCPNPINVKSRGVIPMAILGSAELDVRSIDEESIYLTNGVARVYPIRKAYENVGRPYDPLWPKDDRMACTSSYDVDAYMDMTLKFDTEEVVQAFELNEVPDRSIQEWFIMFNMDQINSGAQMVGSDVVWILNKERNARNRDQSGETYRYRMKHQKK